MGHVDIFRFNLAWRLWDNLRRNFAIWRSRISPPNLSPKSQYPEPLAWNYMEWRLTIDDWRIVDKKYILTAAV